MDLTRPIQWPVDFSITENMAKPCACQAPIITMIDRHVIGRGIIPPM